MTELREIKIGDIVRVREPVALMPLKDDTPAEIPAGIYGEVLEVIEIDRDVFCRVDFHEPYELFNAIPLRVDMLEVMFRFWLN